MCILFHRGEKLGDCFHYFVSMNKPDHLKLDCFRLLADMQKAGVNNREAARRLGKPASTVQRWKEGAEPCYSDAVRLIDLHEYVTRKSVSASA
jgi:DNA-binding transcriptional regulator YiaG